MNNKSISFNQEFIPKILSGQKTQTRRPIKDILDIELDTVIYNSSTGRWDVGDAQAPSPYMHVLSPYQIGDELWVKEPWRYYDWTEEGNPWILYKVGEAKILQENIPETELEKVGDIWANLSDPSNFELDNRASDRKWRSARAMPLWASRIMLEVTGIRVERLEDITIEDCIAEGFTTNLREYEACCDLKQQFFNKWETIYPDLEHNPWVWVIEFKVKEIKK